MQLPQTTPANIDIVLGNFANTELIKGRILKQDSLCLTETTLEWTVSGLAQPKSEDKRIANWNAMCLLDNEIKSCTKLWEIEFVPAVPPAMFTRKELASINNYDTITLFDQKGRPQN